MDTVYNLQFSKLCEAFGLGALLDAPEQIFGGHSNRMYAIHTSSGRYAVKALNPHVMRRPEAKRNYMYSERAAQIAAEQIPALPARVRNGIFMPEIDGQYYLVFDWLDGKILRQDEITAAHCTTIGQILAKLHSIDFSQLGTPGDRYSAEPRIDWALYLQKGLECGAVWATLLSSNMDRLHQWNGCVIESANVLASDVVVSHRDLEPKNVIWQGSSPVIIDWESAGLIHPMHDLMETALYWSNESGRTDKEKFTAFVSGYRSVAGYMCTDWTTILDKGLGSKLGWLEYSLKRSLGIVCADADERKMGTEHVFGTIQILHDYWSMKNKLIDWMAEMDA